MAHAPAAKPGERSAGAELPVWTLKLKEALQRSLHPGLALPPQSEEPVAAAPPPAPAPAASAAPQAAAPQAAAPQAATPQAATPAAAEPAPRPAPAHAGPRPWQEPPARPTRHAEVAHHGPHHRPEARARRTLTPPPRRSHTPPPLAFAAAAAPGSTVVRLQFPQGRQLLALLPQVPRAGEVVDLAEIGASAAQPFDVVSVRWGVHAAGGFTGVTLELRQRA